jgi:hypothetical protein
MLRVLSVGLHTGSMGLVLFVDGLRFSFRRDSLADDGRLINGRQQGDSFGSILAPGHIPTQFTRNTYCLAIA